VNRQPADRVGTHPSKEDPMRTKPAVISAAVIAALATATFAVTANASSAHRSGAPPRQLTLTATTTHESLLNLSGTPDDPTGNSS